MSTTQLRIPKYSIAATFAALLALVLASLVIEQIIMHIPSTPTAQLEEYMRMNHNNAAALQTNWAKYRIPEAGFLDVFVCSPASMLIAGLIFGVMAKRGKAPRNSLLKVSVWTGFSFSIGIILFTWAEQFAIDAMTGATFIIDPSSWSRHTIFQAIAQIVVCAVPFILGACLLGWPAKRVQNTPQTA